MACACTYASLELVSGQSFPCCQSISLTRLALIQLFAPYRAVLFFRLALLYPASQAARLFSETSMELGCAVSLPKYRSDTHIQLAAIHLLSHDMAALSIIQLARIFATTCRACE